MNKKRAAFLTAAALVASAVGMSGASARPVKNRTVVVEYQAPSTAAIVRPTGAAYCASSPAAPALDCIWLEPERGERWVRLEIADATGMPIPAYIAYGDDAVADWVPFCGSSGPSPAFETMTVWLAYPAPDHGLCHGTATTGTVTATFSARR